MKKIYIVAISVGVVAFKVFLNHTFLNHDIKNTIVLKEKLSKYNFFKG